MNVKLVLNLPPNLCYMNLRKVERLVSITRENEIFMSLQDGLLDQFPTFKGDITQDDSKRLFLAQHSVATLKQYCKHSKQCPNNVAMLCCAKNRRCESSRVKSP